MEIKKLIKEKNKTILFVVLVLILLALDIIFYSQFIYNEKSYYTEDHLAYNNKYEIEGNVTIEQTFIANGNNLEAIAIGFDKEFRTYNEEPIQIQIVETKTDTIIAEYDSIYQSPVQKYKKYKFEFEKQKESLEKEYKIIVTYANGTKENALLFNTEKEFNQGKLTINGEEQQANISFELYYHSNYASMIWLTVMIGINILAIVGIWLVTYRKLTLERAFVLVTLAIGFVYVFVIPIYRGHDEHAHFFRAYEISKGVFNTKIENEMSITEIPKAFKDITIESEKYCNVTYYREVIDFLKVETKEGEMIDENGCYMAVYSPIPYIPQALTIVICDLLTDNVAIMFYMTRIVNLIVAVMILYIAIKTIPYGKKIIFLIAIIPTTMTQIATVSPDATTITSCILFISYILKLLYEKKDMTKKEIAKVTILGSVVALCKIVYIPFILLVLLIPKQRYKNKKNYWTSIALMTILPIIINLIWLSIAGSHLALIDANKSSAQTANILTNIPEYIRVVLYTVQYSFGTILTELFGGVLLHTDLVKNGMLVVVPMLVLFVFEILLDEEIKEKLEINIKALLGLSIFMIMCLIVTSLYVQWSPLKWFYVNGIQGRYFIPLLLPATILLGQNQWVKKVGKVNLQAIISYTAIIVNFMSLAQIVITYL